MVSIEGKMVNIDGIKRGRIEIDNKGIISAVGLPTGHADLVLQEQLIFPGFIDLHVHARECADHSWDYKEDFQSAGKAAISGGVVAFADMPNNPTPPIDEISYNQKLALTNKCEVEVLLYAGTNAHSKPLPFSVPYKVYISKSVGDLFFDSYTDLNEVLVNYKGRNVSFHCEDPEILKTQAQAHTHDLKRPERAESLAVEMALNLIEKYQLKGKICHVSTQAGMEKIILAKQRGVSVKVEVTPHHLFFDQTMLQTPEQITLQVNPPIRQSPATRQYLISALKKGDIDFIATDHAPHAWAEKQAGVSGLPQLDTFGSFTTWLIETHGFSPQEILKVCAYNPAQFFNEFSHFKYGELQTGSVGSLTILDLQKPITIKKSQLQTKAHWSPFEGITFPGSVAYTIVKGKIFSNGLI